MKLLYITYIDFDNIASGSGVRPKMMYDGFKDLGLDIKLLQCQQNKRQQRQAKVKEVLKWLKENKVDICYIEPPTGPMFNWIDLKLIKEVHKKGIPIGYFYRDVFWKYPEHWQIPLWKRLILTMMHKRDLIYIKKYCDIVYFVGSDCHGRFRKKAFKHIDYLPPGGASKPVEEDNFSKRNYIYLGGTSPEYGGMRLIEIFEEINKKETRANLFFLVGRDDSQNFQQYKYPWLTIKHTFDRSIIESFYREATYALIPFKKTDYMDLAVPIKLFEYIGFGIPVISTNCNEINKIINELECGVCTREDSNKDLARLIETSLTEREVYIKRKGNTLKAAKNNRWIDRADKVVKDLVGKRKI